MVSEQVKLVTPFLTNEQRQPTHIINVFYDGLRHVFLFSHIFYQEHFVNAKKIYHLGKRTTYRFV